MPRYYRRAAYRRSAARDKYSVEHNAGTLATNASGDGGVTIVPATTIQGMRKVKHLTVNMSDFSNADAYLALYWALVYVPQGTTANTLTIDAGGLYEPNQFVMGCGVFDFNGGPLRVKCPISRNLNSGDTIALVIHAQTASAPAAATFAYNVSYAITLQ